MAYLDELLKDRITALGKQKEHYHGEKQQAEQALQNAEAALARASTEYDELTAELDLRSQK